MVVQDLVLVVVCLLGLGQRACENCLENNLDLEIEVLEVLLGLSEVSWSRWAADCCQMEVG
jgi:hypothetical protein